MTYSNVSQQEMAALLDSRVQGEKSIPYGIYFHPLTPEKCKYAEDTGETAFLRMPCRGNKIICHKIEGHISYTKACSKELCKFFETMKTNP